MNGVALEYNLANITNEENLAVAIRAQGLTTACAAMRLAGTPVAGVDVSMIINRMATDICVHVDTDAGPLHISASIDAGDERTTLVEAVDQAITARGTLTQRLVAPLPACIEAGHPGLLEAMRTCARLMLADAARLDVRGRLAVNLRLTNQDCPNTRRFANLVEAGTPLKGLLRAARELHWRGALSEDVQEAIRRARLGRRSSRRTWR